VNNNFTPSYFTNAVTRFGHLRSLSGVLVSSGPGGLAALLPGHAIVD